MNLKDQTIATYDANATIFSEKFGRLGARIDDIEIALRLLGPRAPIRAVELGCGDGRDAAEIAKRVDWYVGIDASKEFITMAKNRYPHLHFDVADMETADFPNNIDVAFAFASLLHVAPDGVRDIFRRLHTSLTDAGIVFASLQMGDGEDIRHEPTGTRLFHLYTPDSLLACAGKEFEDVYRKPYELNGRQWFEIALRKVKNSPNLSVSRSDQ